MKHLTIDQAAARLREINPIATGAKLREMRRDHYLTLEMLSEIFERAYCPISINSLGKWERGICFPRLDHLYFLACLYSCTLDELVVGMRESQDSESGDQPVPLIVPQLGEHSFVFAYFFNLPVPPFANSSFCSFF